MIRKIDLNLGETVYILQLKNGMRIHILPKEEPYFTTYVELSVAYGALDLDFMREGKPVSTPPGTAHFFEHQIFAMPYGDAFQKFSVLGVDANAMTSYDQTTYLFSATDNVMAAMTHLLEMIDTPYFMKENVDRERSIIAEELKMYMDDVNMEMQDELYRNLYHDHPIKHDIGGTLSSIKSITDETLNEIHQVFYQPSNRLIVIAGKVNLEELVSYFKAYDLKHPIKHPKPHVIYPKEKKRVVVSKARRHKPAGIDKLMIGIKLRPFRLTKEKRIVRELATSILTNMLLGSSSLAYEDLFEKAWINESFYVQTTFEHKAELITVFAETKRVAKLRDYLKDLFTNRAQEIIDEQTFERHKKAYIGQFVYALNHLETKAHLYGKYAHMGVSLFEIVPVLKSLTYDDLKNVLEALKDGNMSVLIYKKA